MTSGLTLSKRPNKEMKLALGTPAFRTLDMRLSASHEDDAYCQRFSRSSTSLFLPSTPRTAEFYSLGAVVFLTAPFSLLPSSRRAYPTGPFHGSASTRPHIRHDLQTAQGQEPACRALVRPIISNPRSLNRRQVWRPIQKLLL